MRKSVYIQWNGHAWDAYEALGVTTESSLEEIQAAYQGQITQGDRESMPFFEAAYQAILRSRSS